jgi:hypothetical protein
LSQWIFGVGERKHFPRNYPYPQVFKSRSSGLPFTYMWMERDTLSKEGNNNQRMRVVTSSLLVKKIAFSNKSLPNSSGRSIKWSLHEWLTLLLKITVGGWERVIPQTPSGDE